MIMRSRIHLLSYTIVCALALAAPGEARAASPPESKAEADALTDKAGALYDEGLALYKKSRWAEARASFLAAWGLEQHWQIAGNLADCELQLGRHREAAAHAAFYKRNAPPNRQQKADALLKSATERVATVAITVEPAGAEVLVDGESVGRAPLEGPIYLDPGQRTISARVPGRPEATRSVIATAGGTVEVPLKVPAAAEVAPAPAPQQEVPDTPTPAPVPAKSTAILAGGVALAAVGLGLGIGGAIASSNNSGTAEELRSELAALSGTGACNDAANAARCEDMRGAYEGTGTFRNVAIAGFALAGAATIAIAAYVLMPTDGASHGGVQAGMSIAPDAGSIVVMGKF